MSKVHVTVEPRNGGCGGCLVFLVVLLLLGAFGVFGSTCQEWIREDIKALMP